MKKIELLAPAGGPEQFKAAVNAGCDAVYLGGSDFNARIGADNFTSEEIRDAVYYGHLRNVKVYVTMNTLMNDADIPRAVKYASELYEVGVDALIIQDYGLGYAIREALPGMELHLSTQATVTDPEGVKAAKDMGYKRVVLARELSLKEIRACSLVGETEVFVHGALCFCYSGQCQLSRYIGGRSGNKGLCAQPCRLPYTHKDADGRRLPNRYPLSPRDLCLIDSLGELIEAGVSSFKIEGRMKSPSYVAAVVSIYRKYTDEYLSKGRYEVSDADRNILLQAFNRNGFTEGYLNGDPGEELMSTVISKNTGLYVGKVRRSLGKRGLLDIDCEREVRLHDVLEVRGPSSPSSLSPSSAVPSFTVTYMEKLADGGLRLGDIRGDAAPGDRVFRPVSQELTDIASRIMKNDITAPVDMFLLAKKGLPARLTVRDRETSLSVTVSEPEFIVGEAVKEGTKEEDMIKQLKKTGGTPFNAARTVIQADENIFVPVSRLNSLRRAALDSLAEKKLSLPRRKPASAIKLPAVPSEAELVPHRSLAELKGEFAVSADRIFPSRTSADRASNGRTMSDCVMADCAPADCAPAQNGEKGGERIMANDIGRIRLHGSEGAAVIGGPALNITNRFSVKALMEIGMSNEYILSPELLERTEMTGVPLMISEHRLAPGTLTDRKGAVYRVEYDDKLHKTFIFCE